MPGHGAASHEAEARIVDRTTDEAVICRGHVHLRRQRCSLTMFWRRRSKQSLSCRHHEICAHGLLQHRASAQARCLTNNIPTLSKYLLARGEVLVGGK